MTAKEQALEYAAKHNSGNEKNEEIFGQMVTEGYVITRTNNSKVIAHARREGRTIIVTETTTTITHEINNGKIVDHTDEITTEIFRAEI